jgi:hypothetical protein
MLGRDRPASIEGAFPVKTPWHLWVVGIVSLLWNAVGAVDYTMTQTRNEAWMGQFSPEQLEYFYGFPSWVVAFWALGVWAAVAGSLLLLARSAAAIWAFVASLVGMTGVTLYQFALSPVAFADIAGAGAIWFSAAIVLVGFALLWYARAMKIRGVLR